MHRSYALVAAAVLSLGADLSWYEAEAPTTLNPLFARTMVDERAQELVFDRLFFRTPIGSQPESRLVDRYERRDGGRGLRIELYPGLSWHDGRPLGADDVCFTVDTIRDPATPLGPSVLPYRRYLEACTVEGPTTATVWFHRPEHEPRDRLQLRILPRHAFPRRPVVPGSAFDHEPIGSGPFRGVLSADGVTFEAFAGAHHPPHVASAALRVEPDPARRLAGVLAGKADGMIVVPPALRAAAGAAAGVRMRSYDLRAWWYVAIDTRHAPWSDPRVREALDASLDRDALRSAALGVDPDDPDPPCELVSGPFVQSSPFYHRGVRPPRADPSVVAARMAEAGAVRQEGRWILDGVPVRVRLGLAASLEEEFPRLGELVAGQLRDAGFAAEVSRLGPEEWEGVAVPGGAGRFDLVIARRSGLDDDPSEVLHTPKDGEGGRNPFAYSDATTDRLLDQLHGAPTDTVARDAMHELHAWLAVDRPMLFLWKLDTKSVWRDRVRSSTIEPYHYFTLVSEWRTAD